MTDFLNTREPGKKFSAAEFKALPRNDDGDIIDLYDAYCFMTADQRELLTCDDWSRMNDYDEELECMIAELDL